MTNNRIWHLVARKISGEASMDELRELEALLQADAELSYQVELYSQYFDHPERKARSEEESLASWQQARSRLESEFPDSFSAAKAEEIFHEPASRNISLKKWLSLAACFMVLAITAALLFFHQPKKGLQPASAPVVVNEMKTMPGTRTKMILPDGTQVWLNSDSYLTYNMDFGKTKREVTLTGEAYFDVTHHPDVPMVVHARSVNIWVKGTAFNVSNYPDAQSVETSLIRGSVEVTTNADPGRKILLRPNEKITIEALPAIPTASRPVASSPSKPSPGTSYYHIDILKESALSKTIPEISWIENKLVFDNEPFSDVIKKMGKWYNAEIILENNELSEKKFSGVFNKESMYEAFSALQMINHFDFNIKGNKVFVR